MNTHRFVLTLGSNDSTADRVSWACRRLVECLGKDALRFSTPKRSAPISFTLSDAPFTDAVAVGYTALSREELAALLKRLEQEAGRTPEQRQRQPAVIPIDIDLIAWEEEILKPQDLTRPYLHDGLSELGEPLLLQKSASMASLEGLDK